MRDDDAINRLDLPLHVDVTCYGCKRLVAMSNTIEHDGRHFCGRCNGSYVPGEQLRAFIFDYEPVSIIEID